jgi:hypothetical protein
MIFLLFPLFSLADGQGDMCELEELRGVVE